MRPLLESEKNYLVCSVLMLICGVGLLALNKATIGWITIALGIVFVIVMIFMYVTENKRHPMTKEQRKQAFEDQKKAKEEMKAARKKNQEKQNSKVSEKKASEEEKKEE